MSQQRTIPFTWLVIASFAHFLLVPNSATAQAEDWTLEATVRGNRILGKPMTWSSQQVTVLARDGHLWDFAPSEATDFRKSANTFRSLSQAEMRAELMREFGRRFEVSGTGHYLVVHPAGARDVWAQRFEDLYRDFMQYFAARGFRPSAPEFPLVAVVFHHQGDFQRFAAKDGVRVSRGVLGYYSPTTNRVLLYDVTAGRQSSQGWQLNAETIIHEATHQTAFNTGVHSRMVQTPRWLAEGLATMFEAPGVYSSRQHRQLTDRINRGRLQQFRKIHAKGPKGIFKQLVESDDLFATNSAAAYSSAWALSFYLAECEPRKYSQYLTLTHDLPARQAYTRAQRMKDFDKVFGSNHTMLEARVHRFIAELP